LIPDSAEIEISYVDNPYH